MNRERAKELLPYIQAFAEGKTVQVRAIDSQNEWNEWNDCSDPSWSYSAEYRIKPEKIVRYVNIYRDGGEAGYSSHKTRANADKSINTFRVACIRIEFEEGQFDD